MPTSAKILLGRIAAAHGVRGDVLVHSFAEVPEDIAAYGPLADASGTRSFTLKVLHVTAKGVVCRIRGISDRDAAEALRGTDLYVARQALPAPAEAEFYHSDLVGLVAFTPDGLLAGKVVAIQNFGAGDLLEIALQDAKGAEFVPFSDAFVPTVDLAAGRIVVRMPEADPDEADEDPGTGGAS